MLKHLDNPRIVFAIVMIVFCVCALLTPIHQTANDVGYTYGNYEDQQESPLGYFWDWVTADSISFFTFVLALASIFQGFFLIRADRSAKLSADRAEKATRDSMELANKQFAVQCKTADTAEKDHGVFRAQFFASHRPKLVLKDVFFASPDNFGRVVFELSNTGGSEAKITGGFIALNFITDARQFKRMTEGDLGATDGAVLKAGELRQFERDTSHAVSFNLSFPDQRRIKIEGTVTPPPDAPLCFFGAILYVDGRGVEFGTERLSVFRRVWDQKSGGFRRSKNPDAEYAD